MLCEVANPAGEIGIVVVVGGVVSPALCKLTVSTAGSVAGVGRAEDVEADRAREQLAEYQRCRFATQTFGGVRGEDFGAGVGRLAPVALLPLSRGPDSDIAVSKWCKRLEAFQTCWAGGGSVNIVVDEVAVEIAGPRRADARRSSMLRIMPNMVESDTELELSGESCLCPPVARGSLGGGREFGGLIGERKR